MPTGQIWTCDGQFCRFISANKTCGGRCSDRCQMDVVLSDHLQHIVRYDARHQSLRQLVRDCSRVCNSDVWCVPTRRGQCNDVYHIHLRMRCFVLFSVPILRDGASFPVASLSGTFGCWPGPYVVDDLPVPGYIGSRDFQIVVFRSNELIHIRLSFTCHPAYLLIQSKPFWRFRF